MTGISPWLAQCHLLRRDPHCFEGFIRQEGWESLESPDFSEAGCLSSLFSLIAAGANNNNNNNLSFAGSWEQELSISVGVWGRPDRLCRQPDLQP